MAAALVFDAAPRMEYRHENRTRLEAAREMGQWLLAQLPEQSEIAVLDTRLGSPAAFLPDRGAAKDRIARLETVANSQPLPAGDRCGRQALCGRAVWTARKSTFSPISRAAAGPSSRPPRLQRQLGELAGLGIYVIDVGIAKPTDYGLGEVHLSGEVLSNRSTLSVETELSCVGARGEPSRRVAPVGCRRQAAETRASRIAKPSRANCGRSSSASADWSRARTKASCGLSARTDWRPTTGDISPWP